MNVKNYREMTVSNQYKVEHMTYKGRLLLYPWDSDLVGYGAHVRELAEQKIECKVLQHWYAKGVEASKVEQEEPKQDSKVENSGGSVDYYKVFIEKPATAEEQYTAECGDVMESLNMTYAEANMFKEIWRTAAARTLGKKKSGNTIVRAAEKIKFFAERNYILNKDK